MKKDYVRLKDVRPGDLLSYSPGWGLVVANIQERTTSHTLLVIIKDELRRNEYIDGAFIVLRRE